MLYLFDLDHTVIDSSHRQSTLPDGSLDLDHWIENNTPEKIAEDSLLPLANIMRGLFRKGREIIIITARVLQDADFRFLHENGIRYHYCYSRALGDNRPDAELKREALEDLIMKKGTIKARFFDDNKSVLAMAKEYGVKVKCAHKANARLRVI